MLKYEVLETEPHQADPTFGIINYNKIPKLKIIMSTVYMTDVNFFYLGFIWYFDNNNKPVIFVKSYKIIEHYNKVVKEEIENFINEKITETYELFKKLYPDSTTFDRLQIDNEIKNHLTP